LEFKEGLTFDDVLLVPKFSDITSRSQTNLETKLSKNISLNIPLISANMDTVTESSMALAMAQQGGLGIIHRFLTIEEETNQILKVKRSGSVMIENPYFIGPESSVNGNFSILCLCRICFASSKLIPSFAVMTSLVIISFTS